MCFSQNGSQYSRFMDLFPGAVQAKLFNIPSLVGVYCEQAVISGHLGPGSLVVITTVVITGSHGFNTRSSPITSKFPIFLFANSDATFELYSQLTPTNNNIQYLVSPGVKCPSVYHRCTSTRVFKNTRTISTFSHLV